MPTAEPATPAYDPCEGSTSGGLSRTHTACQAWWFSPEHDRKIKRFVYPPARHNAVPDVRRAWAPAAAGRTLTAPSGVPAYRALGLSSPTAVQGAQDPQRRSRSSRSRENKVR
jgi:hypothetical protein